MTAKEWLNRGYELDKEINALLRERERAFTAVTRATAVPSGDRVQTTHTNTTESRFVRYVEYTNEIDARIDKLYELKQEILMLINRVEDTRQRQVLIYRYTQFKRWDEIATAMCYSTRQVLRIHGNALANVRELMGAV